MEVLFLSPSEILEIHRDQLARYGGAAGVRDMGLLESACAQPMMTIGENFLHADLYEMGAAYLFHLVGNHPFYDGNKRTGAAAAAVFLLMNDVELNCTEDELLEVVLAVSQGTMKKPSLAEFLRTHAPPMAE